MHTPLDGGLVDPDKNVTPFNVIKKARADGVPKASMESALQSVRVCLIKISFYGDYVPLMPFDVGHILGRKRKGWDGAADNIRGTCSWLYRTYHVCARIASFRSLGRVC